MGGGDNDLKKFFDAGRGEVMRLCNDKMILFLVTRCNTNSLLINITALIYKLHLFTMYTHLQFTIDVHINGRVV